MAILNLKYKLLIIMGLLFISYVSCNNYKPRPIPSGNFSPQLRFEGYQEDEILNSTIILKKGNTVVDSGYFENSSYNKDYFLPQMKFVKNDTIAKNDTIEIYIKNKKYQIYNIEELAVESGGIFFRETPFIVEYTLDGVRCRENNNVILTNN
jgi:hypothetical protein